MKIVFITLFTFLMIGCSSHHLPLKTVEHVDINSYLGTWYEIARYEHFFEKGCSNVSATYVLKNDNTIDVLNRCEKDSHLTQAKGVAYATDESFSKLRVSFFRPFYGDYQIILLDKEYKYAVIGEPSREYFWILSRSKTLSKKILNSILTQMPSFGYDEKQLVWTPQN